MEDIVIIGGGLSGAALLWSLAEAGRQALLLEGSVIGGGGATAHSRGIVRVYDPVPQLAAWSLEGLRFWQSFSEGRPGVYTPVGMAYFLAPENIGRAEAFLSGPGGNSHGMRLARAAEIAERCPVLHDGFAAGDRVALWEPEAGHVDPRAAARALADVAVGQGAAVIEGIPIRRIRQMADHFRVETGFGAVEARQVVMATGAAARLLEEDLPLETRSIVLSCFAAPGGAQPGICLIDEVSQSYLRPGQPGHFYVGGAKPAIGPSPAALEIDAPGAMVENIANARVLLGDHGYQPVNAHLGHDGYTADYLPLLRDPGPGQVGLFTGFSGRGAKYIPVLAQSCVQGWLQRGLI